MSGSIRGQDAIRIMVEEIYDAIGLQRLREFEGKVRARIGPGATAHDWIQAMAAVIVDDDDTKADEGFRRGIRRIRAQAGGSRILTPRT